MLASPETHALLKVPKGLGLWDRHLSSPPRQRRYPADLYREDGQGTRIIDSRQRFQQMHDQLSDMMAMGLGPKHGDSLALSSRVAASLGALPGEQR